jgi:hypothetical protein
MTHSTYSKMTNQNNSLTPQEAMQLSRKERRILGKINGVKIPGTNLPYIKGETPLFALETFTGKRV